MTRYFIELSYKGTHYNGWQIQQNAPSVQEAIQNALSVLLKESIQISGAGRTDTGVHASFYVAHVDIESSFDLSNIDFRYHLNALLPRDIAIHQIYPVSMDMHARFSALKREYKYYIHTQKNPFKSEVSYVFPIKLNVEMMQEAANILLEYSDFTSFAKLHADTKTNNCNVSYAHFEQKENGELIFTIRADRFLRNMVRAIVGTLLWIGRGVLTVEQFREIIEAKDRCRAKASAKACGLFLTDIKY